MSGELTELAKISVQHSRGGCGEAINTDLHGTEKIKEITNSYSPKSNLFVVSLERCCGPKQKTQISKKNYCPYFKIII